MIYILSSSDTSTKRDLSTVFASSSPLFVRFGLPVLLLGELVTGYSPHKDLHVVVSKT